MDVLWGRQHLDYGQVGVAVPAPRVALALSRGLHPKAYRWVEPNEDVAAAVVGERATLLAVADGHHGAGAAEAVVRALVETLGDDPPSELDDGALVRLFHRVNAAALAGGDGSRTTLSLALVADGCLCWAALGDSPVLVAAAGRGVELNAGGGGFLGTPLATSRVDRLLRRGRVALGPGAWVVAATDGLSNFTGPDPAQAAAAVLGDAVDAEAAARALVARAFAGGAGDNVGVAVRAPEGQP